MFPGGLGLRELLSASLGPLIGLSATVGFLAAALDRLVDVVVYGPLAIAVGISERRRETETGAARR